MVPWNVLRSCKTLPGQMAYQTLPDAEGRYKGHCQLPWTASQTCCYWWCPSVEGTLQRWSFLCLASCFLYMHVLMCAADMVALTAAACSSWNFVRACVVLSLPQQQVRQPCFVVVGVCLPTESSTLQPCLQGRKRSAGKYCCWMHTGSPVNTGTVSC